ncbi:RND superfamily putative drug exporter [Kribbella steppae]|uniref:RND superfamily putative drug exporter n=1 Tax=Kribbella steppae TaxID=2512223 RepID=A0A4R2H7A8_9ACTN|nr:MMPL family transporter [Kribbella steppae]TCO22293.1 RND superfamily putative drug exporter [Kribbella steppae]
MPQLLARIGRFSARHRLVVIAIWLAAFAILTGVVASSSASDSASTTSIPSTSASKALDIVHQKFPGTQSSAKTLTLVLQTRGTAKVTDPAVKPEIVRILTQAATIPQVNAVSNPFDPQQPSVSTDGTTVMSTLSFEGVTEANQEQVYDDVLDLAAQARTNLTAEVGGELYAPEVAAMGAGELLGVAVAFLVLLLTFGSLAAAGANMLVAFAGVGVGTLGVLAYGTINPLQDTTLTLATMLGLAVGIDYSLFILTRFRAELREGRSVEDAVARSVGTAGTAVVFAGLTVIIALAGLSVVGISVLRDMGLAGAFGVLMAVLMALTLLPVLLRTLGRRALPRRDRVQAAAGGHRPSVLNRWASFVVRRPVLSLLGAIVVVGVVAVPMLDMKTASNIPGGNDPVSTQRHAYDLVVEKFGGVQSPLVVLVQGDDVSGKLPAVENRLRGLEDVQVVVTSAVTPQNDAALVTVVPRGGPIDDSTKDLVTTIRDQAGTISGVDLQVTGETAIGIDSDAMLHKALIEYVILIVGMSLLLLILMFRSLLIPLAATLGYLLSVGASFGASVAVFQWGWFDSIIPAPQGDPMLSTLPIILVGVLFGLAMDYQVFLVSRIQEMHSRGASPKEAVISGFSKSAPVLVAAAAIMAFVFAGFASSPMAVAASIALGLVVGVIVDAFLVRMIIMPAALSLLGPAAWWLPTWLNRLLPHLDTEGHTLETPLDENKELVLT